MEWKLILSTERRQALKKLIFILMPHRAHSISYYLFHFSLSLCSSLFLFSEPLEIIKYISKLKLVWWWWDPFFDGSRSFWEWLSTQLGSMLLLCYLFMRNDDRLSPRRRRIETAAEEWIRRILKFIVHASAILYLSTISFSSIHRCHGICGDASDVWVSRTYSSRYRRRLVTRTEKKKVLLVIWNFADSAKPPRATLVPCERERSWLANVNEASEHSFLLMLSELFPFILYNSVYTHSHDDVGWQFKTKQFTTLKSIMLFFLLLYTTVLPPHENYKSARASFEAAKSERKRFSSSNLTSEKPKSSLGCFISHKKMNCFWFCYTLLPYIFFLLRPGIELNKLSCCLKHGETFTNMAKKEGILYGDQQRQQ